MFDAREYLATFEVPVFIAPNGRRYEGRILSADEWAPLQAKLKNVENVRWPELQRVLFELTDAIFPKPRWRIWERSVRDWLKRLPPVGQMRAVWSFMQSQASALGMEMKPSPGIQRWLGRPVSVVEVPSSRMAG